MWVTILGVQVYRNSFKRGILRCMIFINEGFSSIDSQTPLISSFCSFPRLCVPGDITPAAAAAAAAEEVKDMSKPQAAAAILVAATEPPEFEKLDCFAR